MPSAKSAIPSRFQSTRPRGARPCCGGSSGSLYVFQSTRPRGARRSSQRSQTSTICFNPRAREGRDAWRFKAETCREVSIHAPARGATATCWIELTTGSFNPRAREGRDSGLSLLSSHLRVSIHAPARGATTARLSILLLSTVSIHAPARGATRRPNHRARHADVSIHAPARGATKTSRAPGDSKLFQSTRPRGARHETVHLQH